MLDFAYVNPTKILFGAGCIAKLGKEIPADAHVLVTYGGGSAERNGTLAEVEAALPGRRISRFGGIEPNPTYETLMRAVEQARRDGVDFLLAVGGGSVIDGTKFIAAAIPFEGEPWDILARQARVTRAVPLGVVLTLPATGSESNAFAVISRAATQDKLAFSTPKVFPRVAALDPARTLSLPERQVANGIVDAFVHVIEQYLTYPAEAPLQDRLAEGILLTLIEEGPKTLADPTAPGPRGSLMWCATLGLNGLIGAGVPQDWATHLIGHEITALTGLDHGRTLAIVLPALLDVRREAKRAKLIQFGKRVWGLSGDDDSVIDQAIARTRAFFESLGVATRLSAAGLAPDLVERIPERLTAHGLTALGERQDIGPDTVAEILRRAL
ncbi:iron-containing alcohol dehydrogenase [Phaeospirillum tilakii]|uniref:Iron-containing alcohol dehydrogenase n=1 Tax=Phaeospirillum tilakii TaxID=741673 RepID=A0ABW5C9L7_9PROT